MARNVKQSRIVRQMDVPEGKLPSRPSAKPTGLYLLELRERAPRSELPKRKLVVSIQVEHEAAERPKVIKITHL